MTDQTLLLANFRCFRKRQEARVAPITVLMGDNSSGKSSFLAAYRAAWNGHLGQLTHDFNEPPFALGAYDQIAHFHGGTAGRARSFSLGMKWAFPDKARLHAEFDSKFGSVSLDFAEHQAQPRVHRAVLELDSYKLEVNFTENWSAANVVVSNGDNRYPLKTREDVSWPTRLAESRDISDFLVGLSHALGRQVESEIKQPENRIIRAFRNFLWIEMDYVRRVPPKAFAPVRTHPKRTYDSIKESEGPEGDHVPQILANYYSQKDRSDWKTLKDALEKFGQESQLFKQIQVKRLGKKPSDPFQIKVAIDGPPANLIDVGYGISQSLPLLVDVIRARRDTTFLIQQPEVHLHPRAQAQLASHFASLTRQERKRFIIETHSDYFLDRLRLEVRNGKEIKKEDVSILYFERKRGEVNITEIKLDDSGNVVSAPRNYRKFFLDEEKRILG